MDEPFETGLVSTSIFGTPEAFGVFGVPIAAPEGRDLTVVLDLKAKDN